MKDKLNIRDELLRMGNGESSSSERQIFIEKIRRMNLDSLTRELTAFLNDPDLGVQWEALNQLLDLDFPAHVDAAIKMLKSESELIRGAICYKLRAMPDKRTLEALTDVLLNDSSGTNRFWAADALGSIGDLKALSSLERARDYDVGTDYEGRPISLSARMAVEEILSRNQK